MLDAYGKALKLERRRLYHYEAPIALQTSLHANTHRDPKKTRKPYEAQDFCLYITAEDRDRPSGQFGACAMELVKRKAFPNWALFTFKDLKDSAEGIPTQNPAFIGKDVMILAPEVVGNEIRGMLIAMESASGSLRTVRSEDSSQGLLVRVPEFFGKFYSSEKGYLEILT